MISAVFTQKRSDRGIKFRPILVGAVGEMRREASVPPERMGFFREPFTATTTEAFMRAVADIEKEILALNEEQRAQLAASILDSLPGVLADPDEGIAEALRRDAELDADPEKALSLEQLDGLIRDRRR